MLDVIVSSLVERKAVEPEGALGCEVGNESEINETYERNTTNKSEGKKHKRYKRNTHGKERLAVSYPVTDEKKRNTHRQGKRTIEEIRQ